MDFVEDVVEFFFGECGCECDECCNGVAVSHFVEFKEDCSGIGFGGDVAEFCGDDIEGFDDFLALLDSDNEISSGLLSLVSEDLFLFIEDSELVGFVLDFVGELVDLVGELVDFGLGFGDFVGGEIDSSVVASNLSFAIDFVSSVFHIGFLLIEDEVLPKGLKHLGNVAERSLVFHLERDGVEEFLAHIEILDFLEFSEH